MSESIPELLRRFLLPLVDLAPIDDDVVVVGDAIDPNGTKTEPFKTHDVPPHALLCRLPLAANVCELPAHVYKGVQSAL